MAKTKRTPTPADESNRSKVSPALDPAEAAGQIARFLEDAAAAFALARRRDGNPPYYLPAGWPLAEKYRIQTERDLDDVPAEHQPVVREQYATAVERFEAHAQELYDNRRRLAEEARSVAGLLAHVDLDGRPLRHFAAVLEAWPGCCPSKEASWIWPSALEPYNAARPDLEEAQSRFEAEARGAKGHCEPGGNASTIGTSSKEAMALALLVQHPDWTDTEIAEAVPCRRQSLYDWQRFRMARQTLKQTGKKSMPKGSKSADGGVEAWDEPDDR